MAAGPCDGPEGLDLRGSNRRPQHRQRQRVISVAATHNISDDTLVSVHIKLLQMCIICSLERAVNVTGAGVTAQRATPGHGKKHEPGYS